MKKNKNKKKKNLIVTMICLFALGAIMVSYAFIYDIVYFGQNENKIKTCSFDVSFKDDNPIQLNNAYPISNDDIDIIEPYTFYVKADKNNCTDMTYNINLYSMCDSCNQVNGTCEINQNYSCNCNNNYQIDPNLINYQLINTRTNEITTGSNPYNMNVTKTLTGAVTDTYELKLWIDASATEEDLYIYENNVPIENADGTYKTKNICIKLKINNGFVDKNLDTSGANVPELATGMVPVYYDETNNVWRKADETNNNPQYRWYSYEDSGETKGMWANAVTVEESKRNEYQSARVGTRIEMDDINTMLVWIPRFSAVTPASFNGGTAAAPRAIDITFVDIATSAHDAFWWDENNDGKMDVGEQKGGIWVGKFENSATTIPTAASNVINEPIIKPDVLSWRFSNIATYFNSMLAMKDAGNMYGFNTTIDPTLDTHMMKNNEWGAVVYLTQSIYGRCSDALTCSEVWINPTCTGASSSSYGASVTGCSGATVSAAIQYNKTKCTAGYEYDGALNNGKSSTTGTVYGIYDMSGGLYEYVMGNYNNVTGSSTLTMADVEEKYKNIYTTAALYTSSAYQHGLVETAGWYSDNAGFLTTSNVWIHRGRYAVHTTSAGVFAYDVSNGAAGSIMGSRLVIIK